MLELEAISKSLRLKRNSNLDTQFFPLEKTVLSTYDIRKSRGRNPKLKTDLLRDGQLQPITINVKTDDTTITKADLENGKYVGNVVNGRTRTIEMLDSMDVFKSVKIETYVNLSELEEDYLNAQINISQNPLSADEKVEFVRKYKDIIDPVALRVAIGVGENMMEHYLEVAEADEEVLEYFRPESEGHGRSEIKVEEYGKMSKAVKQAGIEPTKEIMKALGNQSAKSDLTRDDKRKRMPKIAKRTAELVQIKSISDNYTLDQIVGFAEKETAINGNSGEKLPQNSGEKYKVIDNLLKDTYEFAVILFAEGLFRIDDDGKSVESETKRIIDEVGDVVLVGNEIEKLVEAYDYAINQGKTCTMYAEDVIDMCDILKNDNRRGFIYVNGASLYAQRPEFMNFLKKKYSNSVIAMVVIDLLFGKSQVCQSDRLKERFTVYSGAETFDDVINEFKSRVKFSKVRKYAELPQEKYIIYV